MVHVCVLRFYNNNNQYSLFFSDACTLQILTLSHFALEQLARQVMDKGLKPSLVLLITGGFGFIENVDIKFLMQCLLSFNIYHLMFSLPY